MQNLSIYGGRPTDLKPKILALMKDGRERTTSDICNALGRTSDSLRTSTGAALRQMAEQGKLLRDDSLCSVIWVYTPECSKKSMQKKTNFLPRSQSTQYQAQAAMA